MYRKSLVFMLSVMHVLWLVQGVIEMSNGFDGSLLSLFGSHVSVYFDKSILAGAIILLCIESPQQD